MQYLHQKVLSECKPQDPPFLWSSLSLVSLSGLEGRWTRCLWVTLLRLCGMSYLELGQAISSGSMTAWIRGCSLELNWLYASCFTTSIPNPGQPQDAILGLIFRNKDRSCSFLRFYFPWHFSGPSYVCMRSWASVQQTVPFLHNDNPVNHLC